MSHKRTKFMLNEQVFDQRVWNAYDFDYPAAEAISGFVTFNIHALAFIFMDLRAEQAKDLIHPAC